MNHLSTILTLFPATIVEFAILFSIIDMNPIGIYYCLITQPICWLINGFLKMTSLKLFPNTSIIRRPATMPLTGCGIFPNFANKVDIINLPSGMPSGHAQFMLMFATFWSLYLYEKYGSSGKVWLAIISLWALAFAVCIQRVFTHCHKPVQIGIGGLVGIGLGIGFYYLIKMLMNYTSGSYWTKIVTGYQLLISVGIMVISLGILLIGLTMGARKS